MFLLLVVTISLGLRVSPAETFLTVYCWLQVLTHAHSYICKYTRTHLWTIAYVCLRVSSHKHIRTRAHTHNTRMQVCYNASVIYAIHIPMHSCFYAHVHRCICVYWHLHTIVFVFSGHAFAYNCNRTANNAYHILNEQRSFF